MNYSILYTILGLSLLLSLASCNKDESSYFDRIEEGYMHLDVIVNPQIHPSASSVSLSIDEIRIGDQVADELLPNEALDFDGAIEPSRVHVGSRAILSPGGYSQIEIDFITSPLDGCYVSAQGGNSDPLGMMGSTIYTVQAEGSFLIVDGTTTKRVLMLDMNKLISSSGGSVPDFTFRQYLTSSISARHYDPSEFGEIQGQILRTAASPRQTTQLVVYAYHEGTFDQELEIANNFESTEISTVVRRNDRFTFPVLAPGAYELVVAHYDDVNNDGMLEFSQLLQADAEVRANTRITRVSADAETSIELMLGAPISD